MTFVQLVACQRAGTRPSRSDLGRPSVDVFAALRSLAVIALVAVVSTTALGQTKQRIEKAADLPRFSYQVSGNLEELVRSAEKFTPFAAAVRKDVESVLDKYDIPDKATKRGLLNQLAQLDYLGGRYDAALARAEEIRSLQEKPADKLLSGLRLRAMAQAAKRSDVGGPAYAQAVAEIIKAELDPLPTEVVANDVRELKASAELIGETLVLGNVREVIQPIVSRSGTISSEFTPAILSARFALLATLPLKKTLIGAFSQYLDTHRVVKQNIWAEREAELAPNLGLAPVKVAVWDSGVDAKVFPTQVVKSRDGKPLLIAFDKYSRPSSSALAPLTTQVRKQLPQMMARTKGFSDLRSNIDSTEASEVKSWLSGLTKTEYARAIEGLNMVGNYEHGTHVAGITLAGNPYARLVIARLEFDYGLHPDPCPTKTQTLRDAAAAKQTVAFLKAQGVRVVNMSWGGDVQSIEGALEQCGLGKTPEARKALAREYFDIQKNALTEAFASAPEVLFVTAAGNSNNDPSFVEDIPAAIALPNLLTVGAVDLAGDEASFTSYGAIVKVHANGYQVESYLPGGQRVALSGTSMASPQVANLAAKLLALNPKLTPTEVIRIITETADRTADGRRNLINPKRALGVAKG